MIEKTANQSLIRQIKSFLQIHKQDLIVLQNMETFCPIPNTSPIGRVATICAAAMINHFSYVHTTRIASGMSKPYELMQDANYNYLESVFGDLGEAGTLRKALTFLEVCGIVTVYRGYNSVTHKKKPNKLVFKPLRFQQLLDFFSKPKMSVNDITDAHMPILEAAYVELAALKATENRYYVGAVE